MMDMSMDMVGRQVVDALRTECTSGRPDAYACRRLESLLDQLAEIPEAQRVIAAYHHRTLAVIERRERMAAV
jgi:hypothetical protein